MIKTGIDVNRAVLLVITKTLLGFNNDYVDDVIAEADPKEISEKITNTLFSETLIFLFVVFRINFEGF